MTLRHSLTFPLLAALALSGMVACKKEPKRLELNNRPAITLLQEGEQALKEGKWEHGRKTLRLIEEYLPSSPEFPKAKLLIGDSFFFAKKPSYPEAAAEYQNFLNYFPKHDMRDYALYHVALCHYISIEDAERDQAETRLALEAFQRVITETPGSPYVPEAKTKITQCWRRMAESELMVGIFYVRSRHYVGAETRIKGMLEAYPDYSDRERAYFYLGEALSLKKVSSLQREQLRKDYLTRVGKASLKDLTDAEEDALEAEMKTFEEAEIAKYRKEAIDYFKKLVESYPEGEWAEEAKSRLADIEKS